MAQKLPPAEQELYKKIDVILFEEWDPVGAYTYGGLRDEYRAYVSDVYNMAIVNKSARDIARYLYKVEREKLGLDSFLTVFNQKKRCRDVALMIVEEKRKII